MNLMFIFDAVRITSIVLSLLLIFLSLMPCADEAEAGVDVQYSQIQADQACGHLADICSPLCGCNCCHSHLAQSLFVQEMDLTIPIIEQLSAYKDGIGLNLLQRIFIPPQG